MIIEKDIKPIYYLVLILLICVGFVLKGFNLGETGLGADECFSVYTAQLEPATIIKWLSTGDNPPLWELILHYWIKIFGISNISVRMPSLIFNVLTIIPIYLIGEKFIKKHTGLIASLFFIFSTLSLFLTHEARIYSLLGLLATYSVYFYFSAIRSNKHLFLILLTLTNVLILYSHYLGYWIILIQTLAYFSFKEVRQSLKTKWLYYQFLLLICFLPLIPVLLDRFTNSGVNGTWISPVSGITDLYNMLWKFSNQPLTTVIFVCLLLFGLIKVVIKKFDSYESKLYATLINIFLWVPLLCSFLISFKIGFFLDRYFYFLSPFFYLSVSISISYLLNKYKYYQYAMYIITISLMVFTFNISTVNSRFSGYHQNTELVSQEISKKINKESTAIFLCPQQYDKEIVYYLDQNLFKTCLNDYDQLSAFKVPLNEKGIFPINHYSQITISSTVTDILYIDRDADFHSSGNGISDFLNQTYMYKEQYKVDNVLFTEYKVNQSN